MTDFPPQPAADGLVIAGRRFASRNVVYRGQVINDRRLCLAEQFRDCVGIADVIRIDRDNILNATLWAMAEAIAALKAPPRIALIDGNKTPRVSCEARAIVSGDARCLSIAAASIVAKVTRDRMLVALGRAFPEYGFERHKGYGTPEHKRALTRFGATEHHRRSFRPVQLALGLERA